MALLTRTWGCRGRSSRGLMDRVNSPTMIDQGDTSLCGPAVFLYNVLKREPEDFARYVIDLYETGQAKIGSLEIKPSTDCRNYRVVADEVTAVDWVALASLRDGRNALLDCQSPSNQAAGITLPASLASWFRAANLGQVENKTNLFFDSDLGTLIKASNLFSAGSVVCLLIGANLLRGRPGDTLVPDHWVALSSPVRVGGAPVAALASLGDKVNKDPKLAKEPISFDVFTWGEPSYPVTKRRPGVTVETCIDYFYGYVAAK